jgi:phage replication O-like protein O
MPSCLVKRGRFFVDDNYVFQGFQSPNYTQVPDEVFDELMGRLSGAEFKVLMYIIRRTFGFKKQADNISLSQIADGITTKTGKVLDHGTGLGKTSVARALQSLEEKNIIVRYRRQSHERGYEATTYALNLHPLSQNGTSPSPEMEQALVPKVDRQ